MKTLSPRSLKATGTIPTSCQVKEDLTQWNWFARGKEVKFFFLLPLFHWQAKEPKAVIKVDTINATFQPEKIGHPNGLQITYLRDYSTRNIFVYHDNGKVHQCSTVRAFSVSR